MVNINRAVTIGYVTIQLIIALFVSLVGAYHVKQHLNRSNEIAMKNTIDVIAIEIKSNAEKVQKDGNFLKLYIKTVYKMRAVYGSLVVHSFDVLTDVLVIIQWMDTPDVEGDHIDPQVMAESAIFVLCLSRTISAFAIFMEERNIVSAVLQFFDLLIFVEIFHAHKKVVSSVFSEENIPIETTVSFKYLRHFEAVFESIPESVLQLVYVMRTSTSTMKPIFIISICQSIISMAHAIINNDYTQMHDVELVPYKKRMPPSWRC
eukprot:102726_1